MSETILPTPPVAIFTSGSFTKNMPEFTGPASITGSPSSGLSVGAKAGVGVGVVVGVLLLAALLWFAYTMGKRRSRAVPSNPPEYDGIVHEEGKHSKVTLYSVDSSMPVEKISAIDKAHNTDKAYVSDAKV